MRLNLTFCETDGVFRSISVDELYLHVLLKNTEIKRFNK